LPFLCSGEHVIQGWLRLHVVTLPGAGWRWRCHWEVLECRLRYWDGICPGGEDDDGEATGSAG